jgi:ABC-type Fe3+ transport system substrate-binding protein
MQRPAFIKAIVGSAAARAAAMPVVGVLMLWLAAMWSSAPVAAETVDQLWARAKEEKVLVLWGAGPNAGYDRVAHAFEERFPGIAVKLTDGLSSVLNAKIEEQLSTKKVEIDLAILQTIQDFMAWNRRGLLLAFKPDGFDAINSQSKDKDGAWVAVSKDPIFYGYSKTEQVSPPRLALDFLNSRYRGRLISADPEENDATLFAFTTIVKKYGWGFMTQYMKQQPKFVQGHLAVARSLAAGESLVSFDTTVRSTLEVQRAGGKLALVGPTDDYVPVSFSAEGILKDAPHPYAAKLFVTWLLSKEWQTRTGLYSPRSDVPEPADLPPLSRYRLEERYAEFVSSEDRVSEVRKRFASYSGPR